MHYKLLIGALVTVATVSSALAAVRTRVEGIMNPPQIEIQISSQPVVEIRMLPFPMDGPFAGFELTEAQVRKLIGKHNEHKQ